MTEKNNLYFSTAEYKALSEARQYLLQLVRLSGDPVVDLPEMQKFSNYVGKKLLVLSKTLTKGKST